MNIIPEIKTIITNANRTDDINKLIDYNLRLAGYLFLLAEQEDAAYREYLDAYNARKEFEASYCLSSTSGITKAEKEAIVKSKEHREIEVATEILHNKYKGVRTSTSEFISVLSQKISILRREVELSKKQ